MRITMQKLNTGLLWRILLCVIWTLSTTSYIVFATPAHLIRDYNKAEAVISKAFSASRTSLKQILLGMSRRHRSTYQEKNQICGTRPEPDHLLTNDIPFARIVSGFPADQRWPWQVLLIDREDGRPFCGGVLIGNQHVLTAAHCFDNHDRNSVDVVLGEHDRSLEEGTEQNYTIDCLFIHKEYVATIPYHHDIAMIKMKTGPDREKNSVTITENVLPVCLPTKGQFKKNTMCYITGWGYTNFENLFTGILPDILQEAKVPLIDFKTCQTAYGTLITKQMQCAGYLEGGVRADTCKGDSGGPLVCQAEDGNFTLWGITSWGNNHFCASEPSGPFPGVYTRVDKYLNWINKKLTTDKCK